MAVGSEGITNLDVHHPYYPGYFPSQRVRDPPPRQLCQYKHKGLLRAVHTVCIGSNDWCKNGTPGFDKMCAEYIDMGADSVSCDKKKRPNP